MSVPSIAVSPLDNATAVVNVGLRLSQTAAVNPSGVAVAMPRGRDAAGSRLYDTVTFRQLDDDSNLLADGLASMGVRPGMRLVLMVRPSIDFIALVFAMFKAGVVTVLIDPGMGRRNLIRCLAESDPEGFIGIPLAQAVRSVLARRFPQGEVQRHGRPAVVLGRADDRINFASRRLESRFSARQHAEPTTRRRSSSPRAAPGRPRGCSTSTATSAGRPTKFATFTEFSRARSTCPVFRCLPYSTVRWA
jgi:acyl-CoA synthetase (AMP-forming)/AMP-acid ligase II